MQDIPNRATGVNIRDVGGSSVQNSLHLVRAAGGGGWVMGCLLCACTRPEVHHPHLHQIHLGCTMSRVPGGLRVDCSV